VAKGIYKNIIIVATEFNSVYGFDAGAHFSSSSYFLPSCNSVLVKTVPYASSMPVLPSMMSPGSRRYPLI